MSLALVNSIAGSGYQISAPQKCPAGTYNDEEGLERFEDCTICPKGQFCDGLSPDSVVQNNYPGFDDEYDHGTIEPELCPTTTYNPEEGKNSLTDCLACPGGFKCPNTGMAEPFECGVGKDQNFTLDGYFLKLI